AMECERGGVKRPQRGHSRDGQRGMAIEPFPFLFLYATNGACLDAILGPLSNVMVGLGRRRRPTVVGGPSTSFIGRDDALAGKLVDPRATHEDDEVGECGMTFHARLSHEVP